MSDEELHRAVLAVPGIAAAEVLERPGAGPLVRIWLDGSRDAEDVARDVRRTIGAPASPPSPPPAELVVPLAEGATPPGPPALESIAVVETATGSAVIATGSDGRTATAPVPEPEAVGPAVLAAVAALLDLGEIPVLVAAQVNDVDEVPVMVALVRWGGVLRAGCAVVHAQGPLALGRAMWSALQDVS
ncbi:MAG TPA: hypothetical protein VGC11_04645 [Acidimicrobiia bacterium]